LHGLGGLDELVDSGRHLGAGRRQKRVVVDHRVDGTLPGDPELLAVDLAVVVGRVEVGTFQCVVERHEQPGLGDRIEQAFLHEDDVGPLACAHLRGDLVGELGRGDRLLLERDVGVLFLVELDGVPEVLSAERVEPLGVRDYERHGLVARGGL
jgi:hypothetical protein